jgi:hypothetical protein
VDSAWKEEGGSRKKDPHPWNPGRPLYAIRDDELGADHRRPVMSTVGKFVVNTRGGQDMSARLVQDRDAQPQHSREAGELGLGWREFSSFFTSPGGTVTWILGVILALRLFGSQ